ncbi:MAG: hypothetical protein EBS56_04825 [Planctomycetia bacterium]|nr:hypothetical protein [Planctomycetia bacterium]
MSGCLLMLSSALTGVSTADPAGDHVALHTRYAEARLQLAEARLRTAEQLNQKTPVLLTEADVRRLRSRVAALRGVVATTRERPHGHGLAVQQAEARASSHDAKEDLAAARAVRQRQPAAMSADALRQFEIKAEIAELRVALLEDPAFLDSPLDVMQLQIDQLADLILDAADRLDAAPALDRR